MKIFAFPYVVIDELMKQFEPVDLIKLSFCSKNAHAFVKTFSKIKEEFEIHTIQNHGYILQFHKQHLIGVVSEENMNLLKQVINPHSSLKWFTEQYKHLHICQDVIQGCREITNYICDLFKIPLSTIIFDNEQDTWLLDFAQQRQEQKLKKVLALTDFHVSAEGYSKIMNCNTECLTCMPFPPEHYRRNGKLPPVKELFIMDGFWITREHLLGLESSAAVLCDTELTSSDINAFLRSWLNGGHANLKHLKIHGIAPDDEVYEGLRDRLERVEGEITYNQNDLETDVSFNSNAFHIRREDNVVATVQINAKTFIMAVWPDLNGNFV